MIPPEDARPTEALSHALELFFELHNDYTRTYPEAERQRWATMFPTNLEPAEHDRLLYIFKVAHHELTRCQGIRAERNRKYQERIAAAQRRAHG